MMFQDYGGLHVGEWSEQVKRTQKTSPTRHEKFCSATIIENTEINLNLKGTIMRPFQISRGKSMNDATIVASNFGN